MAFARSALDMRTTIPARPADAKRRHRAIDRSLTDREAAPTRHGESVRRGALLVLAIAAAVALWSSGAFEDPERTVALVRDAGAWGALAFVLAYAFLQPLGVSAHVFGIAAAAIWGGWPAFALALTGATGSAVTSFGYARYVAYDWVQARIPERLRRYESWVVDRGIVGIFVYRLVLFTMIPSQFLMGTLRVRFVPMLIGTVLGFAPTVAVQIFLGEHLWDWIVG